ncbi:MAG: hypothetical protein AAFX02_04030 [Pseudomonadota bacterium]
MRGKLLRSAFLGLALTLTAGSVVAANAQEQAPPPAIELDRSPMTGDRLIEIILRIDPDAEVSGTNNNVVLMRFGEIPVQIVFDENAGRMRAMIPIAEAEGLDAAFMKRMLQANFDSVLDARYAISQGYVFSVFIHPLDTLTEVDFTSGLIQTVTAAATFGREFTSGSAIFGGGDSAELQRELEETLRGAEERGI